MVVFGHTDQRMVVPFLTIIMDQNIIVQQLLVGGTQIPIKLMLMQVKLPMPILKQVGVSR